MANGAAIRLAVLDDSRLFTEALEMRLAGEPQLCFVAGWTSLEQASRHHSATRPDVVLIDLRLGADLVSSVARLLTGARIVVLVGAGAAGELVQAVQAGVKGCVSRDEGVTALIETIVRVHAGETRIPQAVLASLLDALAGQAAGAEDDPLAPLSMRERQVLELLAEGLDRRAIAERLFVSPHTVRTHVQRVLAKLNVHSQLEAVSVALRANRRG